MNFEDFSVVNNGEVATALGLYFKSLMKVGFTREEALAILLKIIEGARNGNN